MIFRWMPRMFRVAAAGFTLMLVASAASGQAKQAGSLLGDDSKFEVYAGYGYWDPFNYGIHGNDYPAIYKPNVTGSLTYYFSRHLGFQVEGSYFSIGRTLKTAAGPCDEVPCSPVGIRRYTGAGGLVYRLPHGRLVPFAHVLGGGERLSGPAYNNLTWGWVVEGGVGVDYVLPFAHNLFALRPIQADYEYQQVSYGPLYLPANQVGGFASFPSMKLSGGLVLRLGGKDMDTKPSGGLMLGCDASPRMAYPGDPVQVTASPMNLKPNRPSSYSWSSNGGQVTQANDSATIATTGLAPGDYVVIGRLVQGREHAECTANFTVKAPEPPTLSCSADPATVQTGGVASITAVGNSPANRQLTYSFTADYGLINGSGSKVQLATAGVTSPTITVTCNVADDLGKTAQATTTVAVTTPPAAVLPPLATTQALCSVSFDRDRKRPVRVDNEAKACLDDIALTLQRESDAKLVIVGNYGDHEKPAQGEQRALNARQYLTDEKGIDAGRIEARYGDNSGRSVDDVLLPAGTTYGDKGTVFDATGVRRIGQPYGRPGQVGETHHRRARRHRHRAAAAAAPVPAQ